MTKAPTKSEISALRLMHETRLGMYPHDVEPWGEEQLSLNQKRGRKARRLMLYRMVDKGWVVRLKPMGFRLTLEGITQIKAAKKRGK